MQRKNLGLMQCPIARSLERVGEWWSILILRDAFLGRSRFDEFAESLGIAPNMLTRRLKGLVESGLLEKRRYQDRPPRCEYVLTERGRDFRPVLISLQVWGNRHFAPEGLSVVLTDVETGVKVDPMLVDRLTGQPINQLTHKNLPGPAASERIKRKLKKNSPSEAASSKSNSLKSNSLKSKPKPSAPRHASGKNRPA
jgi:DNA-binding HxlR family transcriptional regulator